MEGPGAGDHLEIFGDNLESSVDVGADITAFIRSKVYGKHTYLIYGPARVSKLQKLKMEQTFHLPFDDR